MVKEHDFKGVNLLFFGTNVVFNPLTATIFTVFGLEGRVIHKKAWVAKLLGTHLSVQDHKKVKFS